MSDMHKDEPALVLSDVGMKFADGTVALENLDLRVSGGEFLSIIGPSGCGKSTLIRIISGLLQHTHGTVDVDRSNLGYTFQDATLLPWRRVLANVELLMELRGIPPQERTARAAEQIDIVGLQGFEDHYPKSLSGGMKMRASLARSLAIRPDLFLFDEPFGALDEITRERLVEELATHVRRVGFTSVFITHSIAEAVFLSDRVAVMSPRPGRIVEIFDIPFAKPRPSSLRFDPAFINICGTISQALRGGIRAPRLVS